MAQGLVGPGRLLSKYGESVGGLKEAIAAFKRLPQVSQDLLNKATEETARAIWTRARRNVPIRHSQIQGYLGGALRNAIDFDVNKKTGIGMVGLTRATRWVSGGRGKPKVFAGSKVFVLGKGGTAKGGKVIMPSKYGHLVEFGHGGPHAARPRPFMIPAAEAERANYLRRCQDMGVELERKMDIGTVSSARTL
jgi:hypothetical protein